MSIWTGVLPWTWPWTWARVYFLAFFSCYLEVDRSYPRPPRMTKGFQTGLVGP